MKHLYVFQGLDKNRNILYKYSKICKRPKATKPYKYLMDLLEKDKIHIVQTIIVKIPL